MSSERSVTYVSERTERLAVVPVPTRIARRYLCVQRESLCLATARQKRLASRRSRACDTAGEFFGGLLVNQRRFLGQGGREHQSLFFDRREYAQRVFNRALFRFAFRPGLQKVAANE